MWDIHLLQCYAIEPSVSDPMGKKHRRKLHLHGSRTHTQAWASTHQEEQAEQPLGKAGQLAVRHPTRFLPCCCLKGNLSPTDRTNSVTREGHEQPLSH